ncbi:MAG: DUF4386 domain-containing protein [Silicimonas sp.]|nr:DUF4386 domain-containing protein [Silicimonas sp.]
MGHEDKNYRRAGIIVGLLFIVATTFLFLGEFFYKPYLGQPDALMVAANNKPVIAFGLLIELVCILAMPLIGAFIFPVLRRVCTGLALTYFFFRGLEGVILINVALTNKFALLTLSEMVAAGTDAAALESARLLIEAQNAWGNTDGMLYNIIFGLGALILYVTLYRARLIPRWISAFGLIAIGILMAVVLAAVFVDMPPWAQLLVVPIAVQEMVMALWFIFRGFDFATIAATGQKPAVA